jgi:hypothetical protein
VQVVSRHPLPVAIVAAAIVLGVGFFAFARPQYHPQSEGEQIRVPPEHPATSGWTWAEGTPGFQAGTMLGKHHDFNVSGMQPVEVEAAQLAAAHALLDASGVRVVDSVRTDTRGPIAILAAPQLDASPAQTCLAVLLRGNAPVDWRCPQDLAQTHVLVAATARAPFAGTARPLFLIGIARGDVQRVVLDSSLDRHRNLYTRGTTWGQFDVTTNEPPGGVRLLVYDKHGLAQTLRLDVPAGGQRVID